MPISTLPSSAEALLCFWPQPVNKLTANEAISSNELNLFVTQTLLPDQTLLSLPSTFPAGVIFSIVLHFHRKLHCFMPVPAGCTGQVSKETCQVRIWNTWCVSNSIGFEIASAISKAYFAGFFRILPEGFWHIFPWYVSKRILRNAYILFSFRIIV